MCRLVGFSELIFDIIRGSSVTSIDFVYSDWTIGHGSLHLILDWDPGETNISESLYKIKNKKKRKKEKKQLS